MKLFGSSKFSEVIWNNVKSATNDNGVFTERRFISFNSLKIVR